MNPIQQISEFAILYGILGQFESERELIKKLYNFNRVPLYNPSIDGLYQEVCQIVKLHNNKKSIVQYGIESNTEWIYGYSTTSNHEPDYLYKMYLGISSEWLINNLKYILKIILEEGISDFKLGNSAGQLSRADKFIVYDSHLNNLKRLAARLNPLLKETKSHLIPFSCSFFADGKLSWGMDPNLLNSKKIVTSWRLSIAQKIANSIHKHSSYNSSDITLKLIYNDLKEQNIDTIDWKPLL